MVADKWSLIITFENRKQVSLFGALFHPLLSLLLLLFRFYFLSVGCILCFVHSVCLNSLVPWVIDVIFFFRLRVEKNYWINCMFTQCCIFRFFLLFFSIDWIMFGFAHSFIHNDVLVVYGDCRSLVGFSYSYVICIRFVHIPFWYSNSIRWPYSCKMAKSHWTRCVSSDLYRNNINFLLFNLYTKCRKREREREATAEKQKRSSIC